MPPLWQYFLPLRKAKAVESIPAPKGRGSRTPCGFSPANRPFQGTAGRGHDRRRGPPASRRRDGWARAMLVVHLDASWRTPVHIPSNDALFSASASSPHFAFASSTARARRAAASLR